jgi:hypothetical protein
LKARQQTTITTNTIYNVGDTVLAPSRPFFAQVSIFNSRTTVSNDTQKFQAGQCGIFLTFVFSIVASALDTGTSLAIGKRWHDYQLTSATVIQCG